VKSETREKACGQGENMSPDGICREPVGMAYDSDSTHAGGTANAENPQANIRFHAAMAVAPGTSKAMLEGPTDWESWNRRTGFHR